MKKIAILSSVNIKHMSLISLYTDILKREGIAYDIIYMDKYGEDEAFDCANKYRYVNVVKQSWPKLLKELKYMTFWPYAVRQLKKGGYDFVIVWNDLAIFMFGRFLSKHFAGRYCLNVRDNMRYDDPRFAWRYATCFTNAAFNTISSNGYLEFLPKNGEYMQIHSLNLSALEGVPAHTGLRKEGEPIRIGFVGYVRYYERNKKLLDAFANDPRFVLCYYGKNADVLKAYAEEKGITNVDFHDSFPVSDTGKFLEKVDILNNLYGNDNINVRKAISIRYFHAMYTRSGLLVSTNTYVGELAKEAGIGFEVDDDHIDEDMKERLYSWYRSIDFAQLDKNCAQRLETAMEENKNFEKTVMEYLCS